MKTVIKKTAAFLLSAVIMLLAVLPAFADSGAGTAYYVDSVSGNDENDGLSPETAWKSLSRAGVNGFCPGDSLLLKAGQTHSAPFIANGSGSEAAPIVVSSYGEGERPLVASDEYTVLMFIVNVCGWVIDGLDFSAPNGAGILIAAFNGENVENITVKNCSFRNISPNEDNTSRAALSVNCDDSASLVKNIHFDSLKFFDVGWAIHTNGKNAEDDKTVFRSAEESYNSDFVFENIYISNAKFGGMVISSVKNCLVRNCRVLSCATAEGFDPYAPLWMRHSDGVTVEYCEIAGSSNPRDGMAIDFDGWTTNSTYRYIYSHDNNRFIRNCVYDRKTKNSGNSVYNCVSVNDNKSINHSASPLFSTRNFSFSLMHDFSFYDNILIDSSPIIWLGTPSADVHGITFVGTAFDNLIHRLFNIFMPSKAFSYLNGAGDKADEMIMEITKDLPSAE